MIIKKMVALATAIISCISLSACMTVTISPASDETSRELVMECSITLPEEVEADDVEADETVTENAEQEDSAVVGELQTSETSMEDYRTGKPWPCVELEGVVTEDMPADPKDNFILSVNKDFYLNAQIPAEYSQTGTIGNVSANTSQEIADLFTQEESAYSDADSQLAKRYYDLQLDWEARNDAGVEPFMRLVRMLDDVENVSDLNEYFLSVPVEDQLAIPASLGADTDVIDPDAVLGIFAAPGLMLDSPEYLGQVTELGLMRRDMYMRIMEGILPLMGYSEEETEHMIEDTFVLETMMAPVIPSKAQTLQPDYINSTLNYYTRDELIAAQGDFPAVEYTEDVLGYGRQEVWQVVDEKYLKAMSFIYTDDNVPMIKNWMIVRAAVGNAASLNRECYDLYYDVVAEINGIDRKSDEMIASESAMNDLQWETAHLYCNTYVRPEDKAIIEDITESVIESYKEILRDEDFISDETKAAAINKLDNMIVHCMYPDDWSQYVYKDLDIKTAQEGETVFDARAKIAKAVLERDVDRLKHPRDREKWADVIAPTTVNCYNDLYANTTNILAAFCRGDIYNSDMSYEEMLGSIGMVIAHEITHSFDSMGSQFDETGAYRSWWNEADRAEFDAKNKKIADYYSSISVWEGTNINGSIVTGEVCADMGAVRCMLHMAEKVDDFDYDVFFKSYAKLWAEKSRKVRVLTLLTNEHPFGYLRVNAVLQQFDEFLDFYGIEEGDGMYMAEEDRVAIW